MTDWTPHECQKDRLGTTGMLQGQTGHLMNVKRTDWTQECQKDRPQGRQKDRLDMTGMSKGQTGHYMNAKRTD